MSESQALQRIVLSGPIISPELAVAEQNLNALLYETERINIPRLEELMAAHPELKIDPSAQDIFEYEFRLRLGERISTGKPTAIVRCELPRDGSGTEYEKQQAFMMSRALMASLVRPDPELTNIAELINFARLHGVSLDGTKPEISKTFLIALERYFFRDIDEFVALGQSIGMIFPPESIRRALEKKSSEICFSPYSAGRIFNELKAVIEESKAKEVGLNLSYAAVDYGCLRAIASTIEYYSDVNFAQEIIDYASKQGLQLNVRENDGKHCIPMHLERALNRCNDLDGFEMILLFYETNNIPLPLTAEQIERRKERYKKLAASLRVARK